MQIKMFSDTICGWCYIGKVKLDLALKELQLPNSVVTNLPFQLNPQMPETGMDRIDYIKNKFGSIENAKPMYDNMIMQGEQENLEIKLDKIKRTPNTVKSHILIDAAKEEKKENEVIFELFKNYFTMGKDIGDEKILLTIAKKHSLNESLIKDAFQLDQNKKKINQMDLIAKQMGISGVPFYVFNDHVSISGAQSVSTLKQAIQKSVNG